MDEGEHAGDHYGLAELGEMERNFRLAKGVVDPPIKLGHEEVSTSRPAVGWLKDVALERRQDRLGRWRWVLLGEPEDVHPRAAAMVNSRHYRKASAEIYPPGHPDVPAIPGVSGLVLRGVALLGATPPVDKTLADLPHMAFAEKAWAVKALRVRKYGEGASLDRQEIENALKAVGWTDQTIGLVSAVKDDDLAALAMAQTQSAAGMAPPPAAPDAAAAPDAMPAAETPGATPEEATPTREAMLADLTALGMDPSVLEPMDDAALLSLWQEKKGTTLSEPPTVPTPPNMIPTAPPPSGAPKKVTMHYSEQELASLVSRHVAAAVAPILAREAKKDRAARPALWRTYSERWSREGRILPRDADEKATVLNLYHRFMQASADRLIKLSETGPALSELDAVIAEVEARPANYVRFHGEQVREARPGGASSGGGAVVLSPERRQALLGHTARGRTILAHEARTKSKGA